MNSDNNEQQLSPEAQEALVFIRKNLRVTLEAEERMGDCYQPPSSDVKFTVRIMLCGEEIDSDYTWISIPRE